MSYHPVGNTVQWVKILVPAIDCKTLNSIPFELLPTPGAGKLIVISSAFAKYTFVSAAYDTISSLNLVYTGTSYPVYISGGMTGSIINSTASGNSTFSPYSTGLLPDQFNIIENAPLLLSGSADAFGASGDGYLEIYLGYSILML